MASVLEEAGVSVEILNLADKSVDDIPVEKFPQADYYGITCVTATYQSTLQLCRRLKERGEKVVIGGVHPTILPKRTLAETSCDCIVRGEAEYAFRDLVLTGRYTPIIEAGCVQNLDLLPFPARHLFSPSDVVDLTGIHGCEKGVKATTVITSRGCPYSCSFCCKNYPMFKLFRYRSAENVKRELEYLISEYGIEHIRFVDDAFTTNKSRVMALCKAIKGLDISWVAITRADMVDYELLKNMKESGCIQVHIGIESGSQRILNLMNKKITVEKYIRAAEMIKKAGLEFKALLMYGFLTETEKDREATLNLLRKIKPQLVTVSKFVPLPGSDVWLHPNKYGIKLEEEEANDWFYPNSDQEYQRFKRNVEQITKGER